MDKIRVDGSNGLRFSLRRVKGCFTPGSASPFGATSSSIVSTSTTSDLLSRASKSGINPNKAVFTIDSKTSQILIVNNNACQLLGYSSKELCCMKFSELLTNKNKSHVCALAEGQLNSEDGTMVLLSGKVVEMNTKTNNKVAVSLWIRQIDNDGRCLAVAEPVERKICQFTIDYNGIIINADYECLMLFQFESLERLIGLEISVLIPAMLLPLDSSSSTTNIPKHIRKQKATGKTVDGISFPLCLLISHHNDNPIAKPGVPIMNVITSSSSITTTATITTTTTVTTSKTVSNNDITSGVITTTMNLASANTSELSSSTSPSNINNSSNINSNINLNNLYTVTVWVFQNLSGLLVIDEYGFIESCNHHFSMLMFGYAQHKMLNQHISKLIPNFGQEIEYLGITRSRNATESLDDNDGSETETDPLCAIGMHQQQQQNVTTATTATVSLNVLPTSSSASFAIAGYSKTMLSSSVQSNEYVSTISNSNKKDIYHSSYHPPSHENSENDKNIPNLKSVNVTSNNGSDLLTPVNDDSILNQQSYSINITTPTSAASKNFSDFSSSLFSRSTSMICSSENIVNNKNENFRTIRTTMPTSTVVATASTTAPTSTPTQFITKNLSSTSLVQNTVQYLDGKYRGEAIHNDSNVIDILYTISKQILPCGRRIYCVWLCRDLNTIYDDECHEDGNNDGYSGYGGENCDRTQNLTLTFNSVTSTVEHSLGQAIKNTAAQNSLSRPNSVSLISQCEDEQISGEFSKHYTTLKQIGKGAYGYVKMAYRNSDRLLVIAKFILKEKLCPQFMIVTEDKKEIPMEIYLLTTVKHPNIVTVHDVFENDKFFQLVMEKHGSGMDLFEFIDRRPLIDEKLGCFIFKQITNAVNYLHSLNILHRDIKDENIIIDQNFHVKLIDFGSATFMEEGKLFSTFFGTTEYCSPEVLAGNKYAGPELEMWSLGVTLYVLMFFENPFLDVEETLRADLIIPHKVSKNLENLLLGMLEKDPNKRYTMRQLISDPWINQDINPSLFNFAWIVPCESYEAHPEKFYTGQVYSSITALSTTSPQDSLSLVDEDSIIDGEEVDNDENKEKLILEPHQEKFYDNNGRSLTIQNIETITSQVSEQCINSDKFLISSLHDTQQQLQSLNVTDLSKGCAINNSYCITSTENISKSNNIIPSESSLSHKTMLTTTTTTNNSPISSIKQCFSFEKSQKKQQISNNNNNSNHKARHILGKTLSITSKNQTYSNLSKTDVEYKNTLTNSTGISTMTSSVSTMRTASKILASDERIKKFETSIINATLLNSPSNLRKCSTSSIPNTNCMLNENDCNEISKIISGSNDNVSSENKSKNFFHNSKKHISNSLIKIKALSNKLFFSKSEGNISDKKFEKKLPIFNAVSLNDLSTNYNLFSNVCKLTTLSKEKI